MKLAINEEKILKTPITTDTIRAGLMNLLEEGDYTGLAELLRLKRLNLSKIYLKAIKEDRISYIILAYDTYTEGFMSKEDAINIVPSRLIFDYTKKEDINENEVESMPENPLSKEIILADDLNEKGLLAALRRGLREKDPLMIWTTWPLETPLSYRLIWSQAEL